MIFLDTNVFLRALTHADVAANQWMHDIAADLMRRADRGQIEITTCDAVLAEVAFILTAKKHYRLSASDASARLAMILRMRGFKLRDKRTVLLALDLWSSQPTIGFVDALSAAYAQTSGMQLATFDSDFDAIPNLTRWHPN